MTATNPQPDPREMVRSLLAIEDEDALEAALEAAGPAAAARAVCAAPTLERKTELLWAMEDRQRREALEHVPAPLVGALVQNLEEDNRYLLGDVSLEQFQSLLELCSPERKYYWLTTALSFTDARANALPLLIPTRELVEVLMTRSEWVEHVRALAEYPIEHARISPDMLLDPAQTMIDLLGPEGLAREFPIKDAHLSGLLQTVLEFDLDRYADLLRESLRQLNYNENHPLEWEDLTEAPVLLDSLDPIPATLPEGGPEPETGEPAAEERLALALLPIHAPPLVRMAGELAPAQQERVTEELQSLYIRQAVAEGGSFLRSDLQRVARSVEAYLLLGLRAEAEASGGGEGAEARLLALRPLHQVSRSGARVVERLRQVALRVQPLEKLLPAYQRALVRSVVKPRLTLSPEGEPRLRVSPGSDLPELLELDRVTALLHETGAWTAVARALGLERTEQESARAGSVEAFQERLALGAALYSRIEIGLTEPADERRFATEWAWPDQEGAHPDAVSGLHRAAEGWASRGGPDAAMTAATLLPALERLTRRLAA